MQLRSTYSLEPWQFAAVSAWAASKNPNGATHHGIFHVYTGAGKTVLAAAAIVEAVKIHPNTKFAIVVPTEALAAQWVDGLPKMITISKARVGQVGGGVTATFESHDIVVYVLATARRVDAGRSRLARDAEGYRVMLVVDECHKAGARDAQKIFDVRTWARLGLSATPSREDADNIDIYGRTVPIDRQPHGRAIGPVCFKRDLLDGIREGCLPRFALYHHAVQLTDREREVYENVHEEGVRVRSKAVRDLGGEPRLYQAYISGRMRCTEQVRAAAGELQQAYFARKQFLYTASERLRVASLVMEDAFARGEAVHSALIFNERVGEAGDGDEDGSFGAEQLAVFLRKNAKAGMFPFGPDTIAVEHARMPRNDRLIAIEGLRSGKVRILVSVKALQEGLDVPDVGVGLSVASTASGRQRIQTMGRILRPARDKVSGRRLDPNDYPIKQLHFFYVKGTPDQEIYKKESWGEFFTAGNNDWIDWKPGADEGTPGCPLRPPPTEAEAWDQVKTGPFPAKWHGPQAGLTLSWSSLGISVAGSDLPIVNKGEVESFLSKARVPLGRVMKTPGLGIAITWGKADGDGKRPALAWGRMDVEVGSAEDAPPPPELGSVVPVPPRPPSPDRLPGGGLKGQPAVDVPLGGSWYQILQQAGLAWVNNDASTFNAALSILETRRGRARFGRSLLGALHAPPQHVAVRQEAPVIPLETAFLGDPRQMDNIGKAVVGGAAAARDQADVARKVAQEFERLGLSNGKASLLVLANTLRILVGDSREIIAVGKTDD